MSAAAAGRGRGRGANIIAAGMANGDDGPRAAQTAAGADAQAESGAATGEAEVARAPSGPRPHPDNWAIMTKAQRESWKKHTREMVKGKRR